MARRSDADIKIVGVIGHKEKQQEPDQVIQVERFKNKLFHFYRFAAARDLDLRFRRWGLVDQRDRCAFTLLNLGKLPINFKIFAVGRVGREKQTQRPPRTAKKYM